MEFDISKFTGWLKTAAELIDVKGDNNNFINDKEISIFYNKVDALYVEKKISKCQYEQIFPQSPMPPMPIDLFVQQPDAVRVEPIASEKIDNETLANLNGKLTCDNIEGKDSEIAEDSKISPKSYDENSIKEHPYYLDIYNTVEFQLVKRCPRGDQKGKLNEKAKKISQLAPSLHEEYVKKAEYVTKLVIEKCEEYDLTELDAIKLIANRMGNETGGYVFSKAVLAGNPTYKGVMQVDKKTCYCIMREGENVNVDWHDKHFKQDDVKIEALKKKYNIKDAEDLWEKIQNDVVLGLEVGLLAFRAKLHQAGNLEEAHRLYTGRKIPKK